VTCFAAETALSFLIALLAYLQGKTVNMMKKRMIDKKVAMFNTVMV